MTSSNELLFAWLASRAGPARRRLRAAGLVARAAKALAMDPVTVLDAFRELQRAEKVSFTADTMGLPYTGFLSLTAAPKAESGTAAAWRNALTLECDDDALSLALAPCHAVFEGLGENDMRMVVRGLVRVRQLGNRAIGDFGFSVSAREILGSSKVLARLPRAVHRVLGVDRLPSTPRYIVVAGPPAPAAVLLIENPTSFEMAVRAGVDSDVTLIAAYGYGLNVKSDSSAGLALLESVTLGRCEVLSRSGQGHDLSSLFSHPQLFFWGDLDREGLRIALAISKILPNLALSRLYSPMRAMAAAQESSHPYVDMSGKALQAPWVNTGYEAYDELASACAHRAVDQEALDITAHIDLVRQPF